MKKKLKFLAPTLALGMVFGANGVSANDDTVTVKPGDTLWGISNQHESVTLNELRELNPQVNPYNLAIGSTLTIDDDSQTDYPARETFHTVRPGDTLQAIANLHEGVTLNDLYQLNPGIDPYSLTIGSELRVYGSSNESSREVFHTVEPGSTLYSIANLHANLTLDELYELNPGIDPYNLTIGSEVRVR